MNESPNILAVETSSRIGGVALARGSELLLAQTFRADHNHAVELLPTIDQLCQQVRWTAKDLNHVYLSIGPGSFTGLRIAVTLARTLAQFAGVKVAAVPTLEVIAQNALALKPPPERLVVILDAKRSQVYAASFELRGAAYVPIAEPCVADALGFLGDLPQPLFLIGEGIGYHQEALGRLAHHALSESLWPPRVEIVHRLGYERALRGDFASAANLIPLYLRRPEAEEVWEKRRGAE